MIGVEMHYFQELKPKLETSEQDLYYGRGQVWDKAQKLDTKCDGI